MPTVGSSRGISWRGGRTDGRGGVPAGGGGPVRGGGPAGGGGSAGGGGPVGGRGPSPGEGAIAEKIKDSLKRYCGGSMLRTMQHMEHLTGYAYHWGPHQIRRD